MKILLAVDGSHVTARTPACIAAHDDLLGPVARGVLAHRNAPALPIR